MKTHRQRSDVRYKRFLCQWKYIYVSFSFVLMVFVQTTKAYDLLGGRYKTKNNVTSHLNLALDVAKMNEADDFETKLEIYTNGVSDDDLTLQSLSLTSEADMKNNPLYHLFRYTFFDLGYNDEGEDNGYFDGSPVEQYADTIVQDLFSLDIPQIESDAALVMSVWMASVNGIFEALAQCRNQNPDVGIDALDAAVALWVGAGQEEGSNDGGHMLYNLAENAGELFDQDNGETTVNTNVIESFSELQSALTKDGTCEFDDDAYSSGYEIVRKIARTLVGMMTVPLVQNLIHHTMNIENEGGSDRVELFTLGILPRVLPCDPRAYETILGLNVLNDLDVGDEGNAIKAIQGVYSCLGVSCSDVGSYMGGELSACSDSDAVPSKLGAYEVVQQKTDSGISHAYLDRDIKQIDAFLKYDAKDVALDWYRYGWNSDITLQTLAKNEYVPELPDSESAYFSLFSGFYENSDFANEQITNILLSRDTIYYNANTSKEQIRYGVVGLLKYVVMFVASADSLKYARWECTNGNQESAVQFVDDSAMFYIGSMENDANADSSGRGELMFAMAKELCADFDTCVDDDDEGDYYYWYDNRPAGINELIVMKLTDAVKNMRSKNCDAVASLVDTILPAMTMPLIQGIIKYASINEKLKAGSADEALAIGDTLSRGVLPLVDKESPDSANIIMNEMEFILDTKPVPGGLKTVADAFRGKTLTLLGIDCDDLGALVDDPINGDMCTEADETPTTALSPTPKPVPIPNTKPTPTEKNVSKPQQLGFGRYTFADLEAVTIEASFALDVRDMFDALSSDVAKTIYQNGANALQANLFGKDVDGTPTLASLSTQASPVMHDDSMFNIYKYALYEDTDFDGSSLEDFSYANDVVIEALTSGNDKKLAAEATVVLQVYMTIIHKLYSAVRLCDLGGSPESEIDSAVALWIGEGQGEGKFDDGWMLYSVGQSVQKFFGFPEGEAPVNTKLMELFIEAKTAARNCSEDAATELIRSLSHEIIRLLTQPLIKSLLFHMIKNSKNLVELYAVAVIPQVAACNPKGYSELQSALYSGYNQQMILKDGLLNHFATFLKCQRLTCDDIETGADVDENLLDITKRLCIRLGSNKSQNDPLAGYVPQYSVSERARLDLDALEMYIMMRTAAYGAANDIYQFGHNSVEPETINSYTLSELLSSSDEDNKGHKIITDALNRNDIYAKATRGQLAEIARRTLQSIVSYNAVVTQIQSAVKDCKYGLVDSAKEKWDTAVAFFVGSTEGILAGGQTDGSGEWMYALGNEFCDHFNTCETSGEARVNEKIMSQLAGGRDSLVDGECEYLTRTVPKLITSKMVIPLIQGTIISSIKIEDNGSASDPNLIATAHVLSKAIAPIVEEIDSSKASLLSQNFASLSAEGTSIVDIVDLFSDILSDLGIDCDDIGNPNGYYLCSQSNQINGSSSNNDDDTLPVFVKDTPTNLADNLYVTTTNVKDKSNIALDVKDIAEALAEGNNELAQIIYRKGKNSEEFDSEGKLIRTRSLKSLSVESTNDMLMEPEFNMYLYALEAQTYADDLVEKALENSKTSNSEVATEAVMILNVWMEIVHLMHKNLQDCKDKKLHDYSGIYSMDAAVAYWIGDGQIAGDAENGHLLYALSEKFGEAFDIEYGGQSRTNTNILKLFNKAKNEVSLPNACSDSLATYAKLRSIVNRLISLMTVPLIQGLITSLRANDQEKVNVYAHAYVPLVAGCSESLFESLKEKLLQNTINVIEVESIIGLIRQTYACLGLMCDDIGIHEAERANEVPDCNDPETDAHLAGYRPSNDVREYARLDLDIREMDILLRMKAYGAAQDLYLYGKHARGSDEVSLSIGDFATTKHRSIVPEYDAFVRYYETDTYADEIIRTAFAPLQNLWTDDQRRILVIKSSQVLVMYFAAMQNAYGAVSDCESAQKLDFKMKSDSWDKAAAILIGSLEGTRKNGTDEGYMYYDLAQQYCQEFGTCINKRTGVDANEELVSLLFTGRGASLDNSCRALKKAADEISALLLIPIIQGALSTSTQLSNNENLKIRAEGYVYSRALTPFLRKRDAANDLDTYLGNPTQSDRRNMATKTYGALATAYPDMNVDCEKIGNANGVDSCSGVLYVMDYIWIVLGVLGCLLSIGCCGVLFCVYRRRLRSSKLAENNPSFAQSNGELNHSMDLLEKAFSPKISIGDKGDDEMEALNRDDSQSADDYEDDDDNHVDDFQDEVAPLTSSNKKKLKPDVI